MPLKTDKHYKLMGVMLPGNVLISTVIIKKYIDKG